MWVQNLAATLLAVYRNYGEVAAAIDLLRRHLAAYGWSRRCEELVSELRPLARPLVD
jgi:hypothetical protein